MAVLSRLLCGSQQRVDLADFLSIQSYVSSDFRELIRSFVGSSPLILKGFDVVNAPQSIGTTSISITVANSVLYDPTANAGSFFSGLPEGNALSQPIVLGQELRSSATNYIYLTLTTTGTAQDTRAFWDVDLNGGAGGEFNQTINTEAVIVAQAGVSTSGFPQGTIPVAKVEFDSSAITNITDCRNLMFRLGTGGTSPDPNNRFQFPALPSIAYARSEPPSTINSAALPNPFQGGDKNIQTLKEWMDVVMTKIVELSGTTYWYESTGDLSLVKVYDDALGSSLKSKGKWQHDETTIGQVTWTEDIIYRKMNDPRELIVRAGSKLLENEQVMWIKMIRGKKINALDAPVTFINGGSFVNGAANAFQYLSAGDWIKAKGDSEYHYARVVEFYSAQNGGGSPGASPSVALSVKLESAYTGSAGASSAVYTKGEYTAADVQISNRNALDIYSAGGDMYWLANRSDTIQGVSAITTEYKTSVNINSADGASAKLTFLSAHGLVSGDQVIVSGGTPFDGKYQVEKVSDTEVTINTTIVNSTSSAIVTWAIVTTGSRVATGTTFEIESNKHGFASGQTVLISGAGVSTPNNVNGSYVINVRSDTVFQIPYSGGSYSPTLTNAKATCAKVILKTDLGSVEVVQGEEININEPDTQNLLSFIGMDSLAETKPVYAVPNDSYNNTLNGYVNFNSDSQDSLTARVSRLTAMMADRIQDREIKISGRATFRNTTSGSNQVITISGSNLTVTKPGSPAQTITWSSPYELAQNEALIIDVDRNTGSSISPTIVSFNSDSLLKENRFILFYRISDTSVYSWDGSKVLNSSSWTCNDWETSQNKNIIINEQVSANYDGSKIIFNSSVGYVYILVPGTSTYNRVDVSNFTSGITIANDQSAWIRINRTANKTFTNRQTSATYQDSDAAGSIYVTSTGSVPTDQDVVVLYSIQASKLIRHNSATVDRRRIYEEFFTVVTPSSGPTVISLPVDSRNSGATAYYINGSGQLEVALNGQILKINDDYTENGTSGTAQSQITFQSDLSAGDVVRFRLASEGGFYTIDIGTTTTLQQAYDQGTAITIVDGSPVTINASAGYKALQLNGDLGVTGVIDPTGLALTPQAANPLASDHGLWVDSSGNLRQARPGEIITDVNITESITDPSSFLVAGDGIGITVSTVSVDLATDPGLEFDTGKLKTKVDPANVITSTSSGLGITLESSNPGLKISSSKLDVKLDGSRAITSGTSGIGVNLNATNPGLAITANALDAKLNPSGAVTSNASGLGVNLETSNPSLQIATNQLGVKLDGSRAITSGASGVGVNLETSNPGLKITTNKLDVKLDAAGAVVSGASGLGVNLETSNPSLQIATNQLGVKLDGAGAITKGSSGIKVAVDNTTIQIQSNQLVVAGVPNLLSTFTNNSGSNISLGSIVAGGTTDNQIVLASASNLGNAMKTIGVAYAAINNGSSGQVQTAGIATVSISGLTVGKPVYLDPSTPGAVTSTRPTSYGSLIFIVGVAVATNQIALQPRFVSINANMYREVYVQSGALISGSSITLPVDSRSAGATRYYVVGSGYLSVYLNGQLLEIGAEGYSEVGASGADSNSITINQDLADGDRLEFRIEAAQALARALATLT